MECVLLIGSSPHTWRIPATKAFTKDEVGIISTYVENTIQKLLLTFLFQDHLHIRGEYYLKTAEFTVDDRIISTYVENTCLNHQVQS